MAIVPNNEYVGSSRTVYQPNGNKVYVDDTGKWHRVAGDVMARNVVQLGKPIQQIAAAQGVQPAAADVRSVPTSLGAAFTVPSGSRGDYAMQQLQGILGQLEANSARSTAQSQAFAREQMVFQQASNAKAMEFNAEQARLNREWQELMSNTAHQREVADLKAAGLNPILSAMGGNGAPVTSGATASTSPSIGSKGEVYDANAAISGVLSTLLSGQMALEAANINARTQEAVADKYNAANVLVQQMRQDFEASHPSTMWAYIDRLIGDLGRFGSGQSALTGSGQTAQRIVSAIGSAIRSLLSR